MDRNILLFFQYKGIKITDNRSQFYSFQKKIFPCYTEGSKREKEQGGVKNMLGSPQSISLAQTLIISLCGICIVFLCLICLIIAIKLIGIIFTKIGSGTDTTSGNKTQSVTRDDTRAEKEREEISAVLISAVSHASGIPLEKMRVKSIKEK